MSTAEDNAKTGQPLPRAGRAQGRADDIAELYADDATVEDPSAASAHRPPGDPRLLRQPRECETPNPKYSRCAPSATRWRFLGAQGRCRREPMRIEIISVVTFNDEGKIASMKAYWTRQHPRRL